MDADKITYRVTQKMKPETFRTTKDTIVIRDDGTVAVLPKGTVLTLPVPDGAPKIEHKKCSAAYNYGRQLRSNYMETNMSDGWRSVENDPPPLFKRVWVWWPQRELDENDMPTGPIVGGSSLAAERQNGGWCGPEYFENQPNADYWGESSEHSEGPMFWRELPADPPEVEALVATGMAERDAVEDAA